MESPFIKTSNTKRFVIEDSITKVTSDGEPHEMMTMIAGLSGLLAAIVILTILIFLVTCKKNKLKCDKCSESGSCIGYVSKGPTNLSDNDSQSKRTSTVTISNPTTPIHEVSIIYSDDINHDRCSSGNLQNNLNKAFESSELNLQSSLERPKKQKRTHWQDEIETQRETSIQIERY